MIGRPGPRPARSTVRVKTRSVRGAHRAGDGKTLISEEEARELGSYEAILKHFALGSFEPPVLTIVPTNS